MGEQGILLSDNSIEQYLYGPVYMLHCVHKLHLLRSESEAHLVLGTADYIHLFLFIDQEKGSGILRCNHQLMYTPPKQTTCVPLSSSLQITQFKPFQKEGYMCLEPRNPSRVLLRVSETSNQGQCAGQAESQHEVTLG